MTRQEFTDVAAALGLSPALLHYAGPSRTSFNDLIMRVPRFNRETVRVGAGSFTTGADLTGGLLFNGLELEVRVIVSPPEHGDTGNVRCEIAGCFDRVIGPAAVFDAFWRRFSDVMNAATNRLLLCSNDRRVFCAVNYVVLTQFSESYLVQASDMKLAENINFLAMGLEVPGAHRSGPTLSVSVAPAPTTVAAWTTPATPAGPPRRHPGGGRHLSP